MNVNNIYIAMECSAVSSLPGPVLGVVDPIHFPAIIELSHFCARMFVPFSNRFVFCEGIRVTDTAPPPRPLLYMIIWPYRRGHAVASELTHSNQVSGIAMLPCT